MTRTAIAIVLLLLACGRSAPPPHETASPGPAPLTLLVETEIKGRLLARPLGDPFGLAVTRDGHLFVGDRDNSRLIKFDRLLNPLLDIGGFGSQAGLFDRPSFMALDNDLNLIVCDEGNRRVVRYDARLNFVDEIVLIDDEDPLKFGYPAGVSVNRYGETWVADGERDRIAVFNNIGQFDRFVGEFGYSGGQLASPEEIVTTEDGEFVVCDAGNARLVVYDAFGNFVREMTHPGLIYPMAIALVSDGYWVLDGMAATVSKLTASGKLTLMAGPTLAGTTLALKEPSDIEALPDGRLVIADSGNGRVIVCKIIYDDR